MTLENVIQAILFVVPGFLALELYRAYYPGKKKSEFAQITWSLVYGVVIFTIVRLMDRTRFDYALHSDVSGIPGARFVAALLIGGLLIGSALIVWHKIRYEIAVQYPRFKKIAPDSLSIWAAVNHPTNNNWAVVFLADGSTYLGWISEFSYDPNSENHDFLLAEAKRVNDKMEEQYVVYGDGVYLNTRDVKRIEFLQGKITVDGNTGAAESGNCCESNVAILAAIDAGKSKLAMAGGEVLKGAFCIFVIQLFFETMPYAFKGLSDLWMAVIIFAYLLVGPILMVGWNYMPLLFRGPNFTDAIRIRRVVLYSYMALITVGAAGLELMGNVRMNLMDSLVVGMLFLLTVIYIAIDRLGRELYEAIQAAKT